MEKFKLFFIFSISLIFVLTSQISLATTEKNSLAERQKAIIPIAAFTAVGDLDNLKIVLNEGLDSKLTINEIKEILVHTYAYAGFPRSLNGINTFIEVINERESKGIKDELGKEARSISKDIDKNQYGENIRFSLTGRRNTAAYTTFTPVIDDFLKEHLFADLFARDNMTHVDRELTTIGILSGLGNVNAQLRSHMNICMNLGLTTEQMNSFIKVLEDKVSKEKAENAKNVLEEVVKSRKK